MLNNTIFIKGMLCGRCIHAVTDVIRGLGLEAEQVKLGEATIKSADISMDEIQAALKPWGFSLLNSGKLQVYNEVKRLIPEVYSGSFDFTHGFNFSAYISNSLPMNYEAISRTFSELEELSVEQYIIFFRIEKIKALLRSSELPLNELAYRFGYSSVPHLSAQFKQKTGFSPSQFRNAENSENYIQIITDPVKVKGRGHSNFES